MRAAVGVLRNTAVRLNYAKRYARDSWSFMLHCCLPVLRHEPILKHGFLNGCKMRAAARDFTKYCFVSELRHEPILKHSYL